MSLRILLLLFLCCCESDGLDPIIMRLSNGFNVSAYIGSYTLCDAVKLCHDEGKKILSYDALQAIRMSSEFSSVNYSGAPLSARRWWVGLVDALVERDRSKSGWVWIEDGRVTTESEGAGLFYSTEPNNGAGGGEDCVIAEGTMKASDYPCNYKFNAICFTSGFHNQIASNHGSVLYVKTPILNFTQDAAGCSISVSKTSKVACATGCFEFANSDCVGFYWNSVRLECILLPFFDAAVQLNSNSAEEQLQWTRFRRANIY